MKIKHLRCIKFDSNRGQLKNLETLSCRKIAFNKFKLQDFKCLVKLEIHHTAERQIKQIKEIVGERKILNRRALNRPLKVLVSVFEKQLVSCERGFDETNDPVLGSLQRKNFFQCVSNAKEKEGDVKEKNFFQCVSNAKEKEDFGFQKLILFKQTRVYLHQASIITHKLKTKTTIFYPGRIA